MRSLLLVVLACSVQGLLQGKPYKLAILELTNDALELNFTGYNTGACKAASQLVVDIINSRADILPDYNLQLEFRNEESGYAPPRHVIQYANSFNDTAQRNDGAYRSPLILGPIKSIGCQAIGSFLKEIGSVVISLQCADAALDEHDELYPNLYLNTIGGQAVAATAKFTQKVTQTKRAAILTNAQNSFDYGTAIRLHNIAVANGIDVPWFDIVLDVDDDLILSLKRSDVRHIVFMTSYPDVLLRFFCKTYKFGIRGARYVFMFNAIAFLHPATIRNDTVMPGCTKAMIIEQLSISLWATITTAGDYQTVVSELGYTLKEFDVKLRREYLRNSLPSDYVNRVLCHDATLRGLFSLDEAEKRLQKRNLTLRDSASKSDEVMEVVNESVLKSNLTGLRIGRLEYDSKGRQARDVMVFYYFDAQNMTFNYYWTSNQYSSNDSLTSLTGYDIFQIRPFYWTAWNGQPPRDRARTLRKVDEVGGAILGSIIALATTICLFQVVAITVIIRLLIKRKLQRNFPFSKITGLFACILLNIAAILFVGGPVEQMQYVWSTGVVLLVLSGSFVNSVLVCRIMTIIWIDSYGYIQMTYPGGFYQRWSTLSQRVLHQRIFRMRTVLYRADKATLKSSTVFLSLITVFICIWFAFDPIKCEGLLVPSGYFAESDTFLDIYHTTCKSRYHAIWIISVCAVNLIGLFMALLSLASAKIRKKKPQWTELKFIRIGVINAFTLLLATVLIAAIFSGNFANQRIAIASACLALSASSAILWCHPAVTTWHTLRRGVVTSTSASIYR